MDITTTPISRRALLAAGATGLVAAALPSRAAAQTPAAQPASGQTPKRGGTLIYHSGRRVTAHTARGSLSRRSDERGRP